MRTAAAKRAGLLALLVCASVAFVLIVRAHSDEAGSQAPPSAAATEAAAHSLADLPSAAFLSLFVYDANGGVASFMIGGGTDDFRQIAGAVATAAAVDESKDESFSDLLVFSFGSDDTVEIAYSASRNLLSLGGVRYRPAAGLPQMLSRVEKRLT